jgi:TolB protein
MQRTVQQVVSLLLVMAAAVPAAHAQLEITITSGAQQIPIAVVPFGWQAQGAAAPYDVAAVIEQDLARSGYFDAIARQDMISRPTQPTQFNIQDWRIVDVDVVLYGTVLPAAAGSYTIEFHLFDVVRGSELLGFRIASTSDELRSTSHRIADMVYEELTGIPGVFNTRIAYITEERRTPEDRTFRLIVADADGENAAAIAESAQPLMSPAWSPDGRRIAYVSFEGRQSAIYVQPIDDDGPAGQTGEHVTARRE